MLFTPYILILLDKENIREEMENGGKKEKREKFPVKIKRYTRNNESCVFDNDASASASDASHRLNGKSLNPLIHSLFPQLHAYVHSATK